MIRMTSTYKGTVLRCSSDVHCDLCGNGFMWGPDRYSKVPRAYSIKRSLVSEGWIFGKVHKCPNCNHLWNRQNNLQHPHAETSESSLCQI